MLVDDQATALAFYTDMLGFVVKTDVPLGEYRWLTVVGANEPRVCRPCRPRGEERSIDDIVRTPTAVE